MFGLSTFSFICPKIDRDRLGSPTCELPHRCAELTLPQAPMSEKIPVNHSPNASVQTDEVKKVSPVANQSMSNSLPFLARVRIWKDGRWTSLKTVDDAIGFVQERPDELRSSSQWRRVQQLLFFADETRDRIDVVAAHCALIAAIHAEGWSRKDRSD
jgi:hypothetical protein